MLYPLYKPDDELVVDLVNQKNPDASIELSRIKFGKPAVVTDETDPQINTGIDIVARKNSGYRDQVKVTYRRLDIAALFRNTLVFANVNLPKSTADIIDAINEQTGLKLEKENLVIHQIDGQVNPPLSDPEDPDPAPVPHLLTISDTCKSFVGETTVFIGPPPQIGERLSLVITNTKLDGLVYPDGDSAEKGQAYVYSYGINATPIGTYLSSLQVGDIADVTRLTDELNKVFYNEWNANATASDYNATAAKLEYVGPTTVTTQDADGNDVTSPAKPGVNTTYANVALIKLGDLCSNFQGSFYLHFN